MLKAILISGNHSESEHVMASKFRHNGKASYEVVIEAELDEGEMTELINNLIAMRDGK
jgi:hypothetical protein